MNYSICLDQFSTNFNVANLSTNGFSIYTNLDNFTTPIAQNIPYQDLFSPPIGNCPYIANLPQGATQLVVIDACSSMPASIASIFNPSSTTAGNLLTTCCYAIINVPAQPISFCDTSGLEFDLFSASFVGQIIAGNLNSNIGAVTDYKIGWYKNGDYSSPGFTSGYGNAFTPYQLTHPLAANTAPYVTAGGWEGIIHDIAINGITYSSVSGSANGTPIPFESCFGTIVVSPLQCDNGTFPLPYTHQKSFTAVSNGTPPPVIATTYQLDDTTNYFAYSFEGEYIWDELEIKFISGDPNNTGNPTLYSQPIYLEKLQLGNNVILGNLGYSSDIQNNTYPKKMRWGNNFKRILTLTNISRSANPSLPDLLDITITPNPSNSQTNWTLRMQCLDTFDCDDCIDPFPAVKISSITLDRQCCGNQLLSLQLSSSCDCSQTLWDSKLIQSNPTNVVEGYTSGCSSLAVNFPPSGTIQTYTGGYFAINTPTNCFFTDNGSQNIVCHVPPTPNSIINYHKSIPSVNGFPQGIISMSFNNQTDYLLYKNQFISREASLINSIGPIEYNVTNVNYYAWYKLIIPSTNISCGDGALYKLYYIHRTAYPNITYVENPASNYWSITIPMPTIANGIAPSGCSNCSAAIDAWLPQFNQSSIDPIDNINLTNTFGNISNNAVSATCMFQLPPSTLNNQSENFYYKREMPIYSFNTLPFISTPNGWVNLPSLGGVPCPTLISSSMPYTYNVGNNFGSSKGAYYGGKEMSFTYNFPNLTASTDWFQIYTNLTSSAGSTSTNTLIYEYSASIGTVYSSSYFIGGSPTLIIPPFPNC